MSVPLPLPLITTQGKNAKERNFELDEGGYGYGNYLGPEKMSSVSCSVHSWCIQRHKKTWHKNNKRSNERLHRRQNKRAAMGDWKMSARQKAITQIERQMWVLQWLHVNRGKQGEMNQAKRRPRWGYCTTNTNDDDYIKDIQGNAIKHQLWCRKL